MRFELTAKTNIVNFNGHRAVEKGDTFTINIPDGAVRPSTLFASSSYKEAVARQFHCQGIDLPPNRIGSAWWDVKVK